MPNKSKVSFPESADVESAKRLVDTYAFCPSGFGVEISVRIYEVLKPSRPNFDYEFETSHYAHTPTQFGPYITSRPSEASPQAALDRAISGITTYLKGAVLEGHEPKDSWLVKNEFFT
jgi:hypothetical protein